LILIDNTKKTKNKKQKTKNKKQKTKNKKQKTKNKKQKGSFILGYLLEFQLSQVNPIISFQPFL
jgi:hypothetical protein